MRCPVDDVAQLEKLLGLFFGYQRAEIAEFRKAVEQFKTDLPAVLEALRAMIEALTGANAGFRDGAGRFLKHAQETINPSVTDGGRAGNADPAHPDRGDILQGFRRGRFPPPEQRRQGALRPGGHVLHRRAEEAIRSRGWSPITTRSAPLPRRFRSHHEKQTFLKVIYENFYKVYNTKAADRLGVVYTPNEIVRFMIESADWLCQKHFGKSLIDRDVEILDPATGTGTFICELLEHFRGQPAKLSHKYMEELHANEVAILPYYVANLNIEATYAAITGQYAEFPNLCFVDTLDNVAGLRKYARPHQEDMFGCGERRKRRAHQAPERPQDQRHHRQPAVQRQSAERERQQQEPRRTSASTSGSRRPTSSERRRRRRRSYDMYTRFFRWASDRLRRRRDRRVCHEP